MLLLLLVAVARSLLEGAHLLAAPKSELEMLTCLGHGYLGTVGYGDGGIFDVGAVKDIDGDTVEHTRIIVLVINVDVVVVDLLVEDAFGNLEFGRGVLDANEDGIHLRIGQREHTVLKEEGGDGQHNHERRERLHDLEQRDARGLHRQQFEALAQVAERHQ